MFLDLDATLDKGIALIEEAAGERRPVDRVSGNLDTGLSVVDLAGESDWRPALSYSSIMKTVCSQDSPQLQKLCDAARDNDIFVVMGASERSPQDRCI